MKKNINHIINQLKYNYELSKTLDDIVYFELSKNEIIDNYNKLLLGISKWPEYVDNNKINKIIDDYKKYESIISELELCLLDYDEIFNIRDISCSYFELGKELIKFQKEAFKNDK